MIVLDLSKSEECVSSLNKWLVRVAQYIKQYHTTVTPEASKFQKYSETTYLKTARTNKGNVSKPLFVEDCDQAASADDKFDFIVSKFSLPIVVVGSKADLVVANAGLSMKKAREVQGQLRSMCLEVGAALVYTSTASETNCAELKKYVMHRLYPESVVLEAGIEVYSELILPARTTFADSFYVLAG